MDKFAGDKMQEMRLAAELEQVKRENSSLKQSLYSLQSDVFGARLAAKYLDKELAGRFVVTTNMFRAQICFLLDCCHTMIEERKIRFRIKQAIFLAQQKLSTFDLAFEICFKEMQLWPVNITRHTKH